MKSRTSVHKNSAGSSGRREGNAAVVRATAVGAIAGGLIGATIAKSRPGISRTARKVKDWAKSAAESETVKYLVEDAAERVLAKSGKGAAGRARGMSVRRKRERAAASGS